MSPPASAGSPRGAGEAWCNFAADLLVVALKPVFRDTRQGSCPWPQADRRERGYAAELAPRHEEALVSA